MPPAKWAQPYTNDELRGLTFGDATDWVEVASRAFATCQRIQRDNALLTALLSLYADRDPKPVRMDPDPDPRGF